jgi:NDP-sugar pyrophosphorylase family protein
LITFCEKIYLIKVERINMVQIKSAIIIAAGLGTKIWPYNITRQKCAIPIGNIPIISYIIRDLINCGIDEIFIVVNHFSEQIRHLINEEVINIVEQKNPIGTSDAIKHVIDKYEINKNFLIVYGDICCAKENFEEIIRNFEKEQADVLCIVKKLKNNEDPQNWICAKVDPYEYKIHKIVGHPRKDVTHRLGGIFACNNRIIKYIKQNPGIMKNIDVGVMSPIKNFELAQSIQMMIEDGLDIKGVENPEFLVDVDKPWHILEANENLLQYMAKNLTKDYFSDNCSVSESAEINGYVFLDDFAEIGNHVKIDGNLWLGKNSKTLNGVIIENNVVVGNNSILKNYCQVGGPSTIGPQCKIGHMASFEGVCFDRVYLVHYCEFTGVIGSGTDIGAATVCGNLRFDDKKTLHDIKGRKETEPFNRWINFSFLGDYCRTGVNTILMPGSKIGPYSIIGPGVLLQKKNIPEKTIILKEDNTVEKEWAGPDKYGW